MKRHFPLWLFVLALMMTPLFDTMQNGQAHAEAAEKEAEVQRVTSSTDIKEKVEQFEEEGAFKDNAAHALKLYLMAVERFEKQGETKKVIKHMKGLTSLLDHL